LHEEKRTAAPVRMEGKPKSESIKRSKGRRQQKNGKENCGDHRKPTGKRGCGLFRARDRRKEGNRRSFVITPETANKKDREVSEDAEKDVRRATPSQRLG